MSQYNLIEAGATERFFTVVARASGSPIISGTVNYYCKAKSGLNAGKWWRDSDQSWQAAETANPMTHEADGHWAIDLTTSPFTDGIRFLEYVKESGDLHVPDARHLVCETGLGTGTGPRLVTLTITNGTDPLPNVAARLASTTRSYVGTTNASGVVTFGVIEDTYTVILALPNHNFVPVSLVVDGDETTTYAMSVMTPLDPDGASLTTGYVLCLDDDGLPAADIEIQAQLVSGPGTAGQSPSGSVITITSGADGIAQHAFVQGGEYRFRRGSSDWTPTTYVAPTEDTWALPEVLGQP